MLPIPWKFNVPSFYNIVNIEVFCFIVFFTASLKWSVFEGATPYKYEQYSRMDLIWESKRVYGLERERYFLGLKRNLNFLDAEAAIAFTCLCLVRLRTIDSIFWDYVIHNYGEGAFLCWTMEMNFQCAVLYMYLASSSWSFLFLF